MIRNIGFMILFGTALFVSGLLVDKYLFSEPEIKWQTEKADILESHWDSCLTKESKYSLDYHNLGAEAEDKHLSMLQTDGKSFIGFTTAKGIYQVYDDINDTKYFPEGFDMVYEKVTKTLLNQTKEQVKQ